MDRSEPEVGDMMLYTNRDGVVVSTITVTEIVKATPPSEWGAKALDTSMAPTCPSVPAGKELSYAKVEGRDTPTPKEAREKFFLTKEQHLERMAYVKGDPKQERKHGWWYATVVCKQEYIQVGNNK